ncbi:diguanylate cyclase domain-containing protein [Salinispora mooreana]|uniref:diguanylate cyclase domain-containing protein n=1 Tax=Salinispora mooreana TaxID=999545 RepID=UPI00035F4D02|nr:GGDEF domain-containing protein [Salinispora mooreana]
MFHPLLDLPAPDPSAPESAAFVAGLLLAAAAALTSRHRIRALRHELAALRLAALLDPLTGLANRAGLTQAWVHLAPTRPHVAVIDLDGFKPINDTHGHAAGDILLTTIAHRLQTVTTAARLGGDEFAALICDPNPTTTAARLAHTIAAPVRLPSGATVCVTASIGLAPTAGDLPAALAAADAAMYRAKTSKTGPAVYDPARDDHTAPDSRPGVRTRDLPTPTPWHLPTTEAIA